MKKNMIDAENNKTNQNLLEHSIFIIWKTEYNIGIPIVDEQHRGIVTTINSLYYGIQNNYAEAMLSPIIEMINNYSRIHFQIEETFLDKIDSANAERHRGLHRDLLLTLGHMGRKSITDKDPYQFMNFLKKWWVDHICNEDLIYRNFLPK